jgi:hypothetical protein
MISVIKRNGSLLFIQGKAYPSIRTPQILVFLVDKKATASIIDFVP